MFSVCRVAEAWHSRLMYMEGSCYVAIADIEGCCCVAALDEEGSWKDVVVLQHRMKKDPGRILLCCSSRCRRI